MLQGLDVRMGYGAGTGSSSVAQVRDEAVWAARAGFGVASGADLTLAGSIDQILEGLARYADAGATDLGVMIDARTDDERAATREALADLLG